MTFSSSALKLYSAISDMQSRPFSSLMDGDVDIGTTREYDSSSGFASPPLSSLDQPLCGSKSCSTESKTAISSSSDGASYDVSRGYGKSSSDYLIDIDETDIDGCVERIVFVPRLPVHGVFKLPSGYPHVLAAHRASTVPIRHGYG